MSFKRKSAFLNFHVCLPDRNSKGHFIQVAQFTTQVNGSHAQLLDVDAYVF